MKITELKEQLEYDVADLLNEFAEATELCPYWVKVYWRPTSDDGRYADVEIHCGTEFKLTPLDQ